MAADLSDARANIILDALPTMFLALSSTQPTLAGGNITEPAQGDYVRPTLTFAAAATRARVTTAAANFVSGDGLADGSAGNFLFYAIMTASSGGTMIWRGALSSALAWVVGQPVQIASGQLTIRFPST